MHVSFCAVMRHSSVERILHETAHNKASELFGGSWFLEGEPAVEFSKSNFVVLWDPQAKWHLVPLYWRDGSHLTKTEQITPKRSRCTTGKRKNLLLIVGWTVTLTLKCATLSGPDSCHKVSGNECRTLMPTGEILPFFGCLLTFVPLSRPTARVVCMAWACRRPLSRAASWTPWNTGQISLGRPRRILTHTQWKKAIINMLPPLLISAWTAKAGISSLLSANRVWYGTAPFLMGVGRTISSSSHQCCLCSRRSLRSSHSLVVSVCLQQQAGGLSSRAGPEVGCSSISRSGTTKHIIQDGRRSRQGCMLTRILTVLFKEA